MNTFFIYYLVEFFFYHFISRSVLEATVVHSVTVTLEMTSSEPLSLTVYR